MVDKQFLVSTLEQMSILAKNIQRDTENLAQYISDQVSPEEPEPATAYDKCQRQVVYAMRAMMEIQHTVYKIPKGPRRLEIAHAIRGVAQDASILASEISSRAEKRPNFDDIDEP